MAKNLVVCCDGTWNNLEQEENGIATPTNVVKLYHALAEKDAQGVVQKKYYHPGVGGEKLGWVAEKTGGAFGCGISRNIQSAYHWVATNYDEGDRIYLFGFSRGAFTVRSLASFIGRGLLDLRKFKYEDESWARVKKAYEDGYRQPDSGTTDWAEPGWKFFSDGDPVPIQFLGVWDTVGALGVPDDLELFNFFDRKENWGFHNTALGAHVLHARHAMAIDEVRSCFTVTHWSNTDNHADARELWFPGAHSDVGGGYPETALSNGALKWMIEESVGFQLGFRSDLDIPCDPCGAMHNSYKGAFSKLRSRPRNYPAITERNKDLFHESVFLRQAKSPLAYPSYHPVRNLEVGQSTTVEVFAGKHWNTTDIYFDAGQEYTFSAQGKWLDRNDSCDWKGTQNGEFTVGDVIRSFHSLLGMGEASVNWLTKNSSTDFLGTKRVEKFKWFTMVGAIANDNGVSDAVKNDGSPVPHEYIDMPEFEKKPFRVGKPGYLYCFPNDAWGFYGNNHGSVELTIHRVK